MGPTPAALKPLLSVGGIPLIERLLRQMLDASATRITVIIGRDGERIREHLLALRGMPAELELTFLREHEPRGNVGALSLLPRDLPCLLCFADLVTTFDFSRLVDIHRERGDDVTLASHRESMRVRLGELTVDGDRVLAYREKPAHPLIICSGIALFEPQVLDLIAPDRPTGIADLVQRAIDERRRVSHWLHGASWIDVNTPEELAQANKLLLGTKDAETP